MEGEKRMIIGIGIDIVELTRIEKSLDNPKFIKRILTEKEEEEFYLLSANRKIEFLAGRFAAKEAFVKALGTGISKECGWHDIEITNDKRGRPLIQYNGDKRYHLSISHSQTYAVAQVIIEDI